MSLDGLVLTMADIRRHASVVPWVEEIQVEQDLLLSMAMVALFKDAFLSREIAMRGGTILHKVHLAPAARYSEDIDLVAVGERPGTHINAALKRVLLPLLGKHATDVVAKVKLTLRDAVKRSSIIRLECRWPSVAVPGKSLKLKVEVNTTERTPHVPVVKMPFSVGLQGLVHQTTVVSYDINEMLGTKMRALFQRKHGRDLFDLYWALTASAAIQPDPKKIVAAFQHYMRAEGSPISRQAFYKALDERVTDPDFRSDMLALLRQGIEYDVDVAGALVRKQLLARLPV